MKKKATIEIFSCSADISLKVPLGGSKVDSAFHPSEVDKMSTRNFQGLSGKK